MKRSFDGTLAERFHRPKRPPLRTTAELAEELGIPQASLVSCLNHAGIKPELDNRRHTSHRVCWYNRREVLKWWRSRQLGAATNSA